MGILDDFDFENLPVPEAVEEGEYELRIVDAKEHTSKNSGRPSIYLAFEVISEPNAEMIYHYMGLPDSNDTERVKNTKLRRVKEFFDAFGVDKSSDYNEWIGQSAYALLGIEEDTQTGLPRNRVKRFIASA